MERSVAIKKLTKLLGKKLGYRVDPKAPKQDERDAARAELDATREAFERLKNTLEARHMELLAADTEYQRLKAEVKAERERRKKLSGVMRWYKITVGHSVAGMFFHVQAEGDTWEEVIAKLTAKAKAAA